MSDEDHGHTLIAHALSASTSPGDPPDQTGRQLIEDRQLWAANGRQRDRQALALSTRQVGEPIRRLSGRPSIRASTNRLIHEVTFRRREQQPRQTDHLVPLPL